MKRLALTHRTPAGALLLLLLLSAAAPATAVEAPGGPAEAVPEPLTWEGLPGQLEGAAADGFSGSVLVVRKGEIVLDRGYGFADPAGKIPNRPDTIYAIGSTPIDFTRAGILLLDQEGRLRLSDPISKFFGNVPPDKVAITIDQLMEGRSGLRDFLGRPSDPDPDHFFIDRHEAMRRIFEDALLFEPGEGRRHSHAAWGVLAAIIEIASGQSYQEFTRSRLLAPAGMKDTGFFGESYPKDRMAIGRGPRTTGEINAPPFWGPTSWLVMGSGGQYSTTGDIYRWHRAIAEGKILDPVHQERYWAPKGSFLSGGDEFGFEIRYTQGPETMMILISNAGGPAGMARIDGLGMRLARLVQSGDLPRFTLGVEMAVTDTGGVIVQRVVEGGAAARAGIRAGDRLLSADGTPLDEDPLGALDPFLSTGKSFRLEIERDGARLSLDVTPLPRAS